MAYTEFASRSGGSNLNAGTRTGNSTEPGTTPTFAYNGTFLTNTFTVTSGAQGGSTTNPQTDGVAAGDFVHVSDGTNVGRIARVSSVTASTIVLNGTATVGSGVGGVLARIGGAWAGPAAGVGFPVGTITSALTNTTGNLPRLNLKNDQTYSISTGLAQSQAGTHLEGYTSTFGDGGRATIDGSTNTIVLLTISASSSAANLIAQNNGASGTNAAISITAGNVQLFGCVANTVRGAGFSLAGATHVLVECEAYACNSANTASSGGVLQTAAATLIRCTLHDNLGSNNNGIAMTGGPCTLIDCVIESNANDGILMTTPTNVAIHNCDIYNNGRDGLESTGTAVPFFAENVNQIKNGRYGFEQPASPSRNWFLFNCGYGAGTQINTSGTTSGVAIQETAPITYAANLTPWVDPANGDFRISLPAAMGTGRGTFTETAASYAGTVGYSDVGSAQHRGAGSILTSGIIQGLGAV